MTSPTPMCLEARDVQFGYGTVSAQQAPAELVVDVPELTLERGDSIAIIGPSGCGKTTFLHLLAGLITPHSGSIKLLGEEITGLSESERDRVRGQHVGMVFQRLHLLSALSVRDNVLLGQRLARKSIDGDRVDALFERLGLSAVARHRPSELSQGQAQRVAIARALVHEPALLMADEPTSALDDHNAEEAISLLQESAAAVNAGLLIVTHDQRARGRLAREFDMGLGTGMPA